MKTSVTIVFTLLFIAVAGYYFVFNNSQPKPLPGTPNAVVSEAAPPSNRLLPFDKETNIKMIQIQKPSSKETVTIELKDGQWFLKYPIKYAADSMMAQGLLTALKVSHKARRLNREKDWSEYGLAVPDIKIGIEAEGQPRHYLLLGDYSPVADMVYARWEGEEEYFLLDARFKSAFDRSSYSLREKKIARIPLRKIEKIHVRTPSDNYEIAQKNNKWYWTEPVSQIGRTLTDSDMYEILTMLRDLNVKEFLDNEPYKAEKQGFVEESPYIQLWGEGRTSIFRIGNEIPEHNSFYAIFDNEKVLLEVAKANIENFLKVFDSIGIAFRKRRAEQPVALPTAPAAEEAVKPAASGSPDASQVPKAA